MLQTFSFIENSMTSLAGHVFPVLVLAFIVALIIFPIVVFWAAWRDFGATTYALEVLPICLLALVICWGMAWLSCDGMIHVYYGVPYSYEHKTVKK